MWLSFSASITTQASVFPSRPLESGLGRRRWMYLHGKHFARVKKLEEQRKRRSASQLPHQLRSILFHQSTDSLAFSGPLATRL